MIPKSLNAVGEDDLVALVNNEVAEGRTIDYKRELPGNSDSAKKEFLADSSSFANTSGGDLIFGIEEDVGVPTRVTGLQVADIDLEIRRLESILAAGLSPRIRYAMSRLVTQAGLKILIMRVDRSWTGPHRVIFQGSDKFYGRNSARKYPLDVNELRSAFTLSNTVTERIRAFRTDRIIALSNNDTPMPFTDDPKIVLHCIPLESFAGGPQHDVLPFHQNPARLAPMGTTSWTRRLNLEGVVAFGMHQPCLTYTQLYRSGIIEAVRGNLLAQERNGELIIPSVSYERYVFEYLSRCFRVIQELGASPPVLVALSLLKTRGLKMSVDTLSTGESSESIGSDSVILPETIVEDLSLPVGPVLKPLFDLIWNACGLTGSKNFDADGNWINR
jgi:hypothetical protein